MSRQALDELVNDLRWCCNKIGDELYDMEKLLDKLDAESIAIGEDIEGAAETILQLERDLEDAQD